MQGEGKEEEGRKGRNVEANVPIQVPPLAISPGLDERNGDLGEAALDGEVQGGVADSVLNQRIEVLARDKAVEEKMSGEGVLEGSAEGRRAWSGSLRRG